MALFKLLAGRYLGKDADGNRKTFRAGQVVESDQDLVAIGGRDKFLLLQGKPKKASAQTEAHTFPHGQVHSGKPKAVSGEGPVTQTLSDESDELLPVDVQRNAAHGKLSKKDQRPREGQDLEEGQERDKKLAKGDKTPANKEEGQDFEAEELQSMKVEELRQLAHDEGIDLEGSTRKADMIDAILKSKRGE